MLVESGSFLILDDEFMLVNLRFSKEYDSRRITEETCLT